MPPVEQIAGPVDEERAGQPVHSDAVRRPEGTLLPLEAVAVAQFVSALPVTWQPISQEVHVREVAARSGDVCLVAVVIEQDILLRRLVRNEGVQRPRGPDCPTKG